MLICPEINVCLFLLSRLGYVERNFKSLDCQKNLLKNCRRVIEKKEEPFGGGIGRRWRNFDIWGVRKVLCFAWWWWGKFTDKAVRWNYCLGHYVLWDFNLDLFRGFVCLLKSFCGGVYLVDWLDEGSGLGSGFLMKMYLKDITDLEFLRVFCEIHLQWLLSLKSFQWGYWNKGGGGGREW